MVLIDVKVPQLSESVSEATILIWKKKNGEIVTKNEILVEIETDKVILEVPAPASGMLSEITVFNGDTVFSDQVIAKIDSHFNLNVESQVHSNISENISNEHKKIKTMPSAAKLIAENQSSNVIGTGKDGRITKKDVLSILTEKSKENVISSNIEVSSNKKSIHSERLEKRVPMSRLRLRIAERLLQSQKTNAILTTFNEVNMAYIIDIRNKYKEKFEKKHSVKLGFMSFFVKAVVHSLKKFPILNSFIDKNDIVYHDYFDIGIAVSSSRGLSVPILRNADQMDISDIEKKILEFSLKAKEGKLSLEELSGGTFSISNGGVFGSMLSTPIINPPQSAILGIHATKDRPIVENGQVVIRPMNYLALSYDHRIIDGRDAVLGLLSIKEALEDPTCLFLDL